MNLDSRSTRNSWRHLSANYEWETLPSIDKNALFAAARESSPTAFTGKAGKDEIHAIRVWRSPKKSDYERYSFDRWSSGISTTFHRTRRHRNTAPLSGLKLAASPTPSLAALQLRKETQELEIKKLELQLQLAQLQSTQTAAPNSTELPPGKSLSDLEAPQKTLHPQPWPRIFVPGEPKMYTESSLPDFVWGV